MRRETNMKQVWAGIVIGCLWIVALTVLAPAAEAVFGGSGNSDPCRQDVDEFALACGRFTNTAEYGTALGYWAVGGSRSDVAIGARARAEGGTGENIAIGGPAEIGGIMWETHAQGGGAMALGAGATANGQGTIAFGRIADARGEMSVVLGEGSSDGGREGVVSFGNDSFHRDLINVKDISSSGQITARSFWAVGGMDVGSAVVRNGLTVGAGGASIVGGIDANNAKIVGVANGEISENSQDAVNGSQLYETNQNVQAAHADALAALAGLEQMMNQLLQTGICNRLSALVIEVKPEHAFSF